MGGGVFCFISVQFWWGVGDGAFAACHNVLVVIGC